MFARLSSAGSGWKCRSVHNRTSRFALAILPGAVAVFLAAAVFPAGSAAFTAHWTNRLDGTWSNPANWDLHQVPNNVGADVYTTTFADTNLPAQHLLYQVRPSP